MFPPTCPPSLLLPPPPRPLLSASAFPQRLARVPTSVLTAIACQNHSIRIGLKKQTDLLGWEKITERLMISALPPPSPAEALRFYRSDPDLLYSGTSPIRKRIPP